MVLVTKRIIKGLLQLFFIRPVCIYVFVTIQPGVFQDWVEMGGNAVHPPVPKHTHTHTLRADKADLSEQMSRQQSSQHAEEKELNPC